MMSGALTLIGFIGLWLCNLLEDHPAMTGPQPKDMASGSLALYIFSGCFVSGLLILFPLSILLQRIAHVPLPGPTVPKWIAWPFVIIMYALIFLLLIGLLGVAWHVIFDK